MLSEAPDAHTITPPAKAWRNYYRVYQVLHLDRLGHIFPGVHGGPDVFPSKEIAEAKARAFLNMLHSPAFTPPGRTLMEYAGAYPEGDRAN